MIEPNDNAAERFAACLDVVLKLEGGYADNPADPGGATNMGITRATLAAWRGVSPVSALPKDVVRGLGRTEAAAIYRANYWNRCRGDDLPAGLDLAVFDFAVNSGPDRAIKALQQAVGVSADGIIGPLTLAAVEARRAVIGKVIAAICGGRLSFLQRLATYATFGRGWTSRVATIKRTAMQMAGASLPSVQPGDRTMSVLSGYRTYIVAGLMLLAALAELAGVPVPAIDGHSAGHLLMEAFAIIFLRKSIAKAGT